MRIRQCNLWLLREAFVVDNYFKMGAATCAMYLSVFLCGCVAGKKDDYAASVYINPYGASLRSYKYISVSDVPYSIYAGDRHVNLGVNAGALISSGNDPWVKSNFEDIFRLMGYIIIDNKAKGYDERLMRVSCNERFESFSMIYTKGVPFSKMTMSCIFIDAKSGNIVHKSGGSAEFSSGLFSGGKVYEDTSDDEIGAKISIISRIAFFFSKRPQPKPIPISVIGYSRGNMNGISADREEALADAKSKAIEMSGVSIESRTAFSKKYDGDNIVRDYKVYVESAAKGVLLDGYKIYDYGYSSDNVYVVKIDGSVIADE
jgi:hypothetical protein